MSICLLLNLLFPAMGNAQDLEAEQLKQQFNRYSSLAIQEKVFVHSDRSFYMAGETMWFKLHVVDGSSHVPSDLSKVAYLEVVDEAQKPVLQTKIPLQKGAGSGSLYLPVSLKSGNFTIRAYTSWMKNFSPDFYFEKPVTLINSFLNPNLIATKAQETPVLQFFPEGGRLVEGIRSKLAFKASSPEGRGIDFEGAVIDQDQDTIAVFEPLKFGMGSFYFTPEADKTYQAIIKSSQGDSLSYPLPAVAKQGYVMHVEEMAASTTSGAAEGIKLAVHSNQQKDGFVYLLVHTRQQLKVARAGRLQDGRVEFMLEKELLEEGISHLTIFDQLKKPVAERLYFQQPQQKLHIKAATDQEVYALREQVAIDITAQDQQKPALADLSVSVYQLDSLNTKQSQSIFSYLWLNSDLKGRIEAPEYYMQHKGPEVNSALDHLMLTHGWRRFRWEDVLATTEPVLQFLPEYEGQLLEALVMHKDNGLPAEDVTAYLSMPGKDGLFYNGRSNEKGEIRFISQEFYGRKNLVLQKTPQENRSLSFQILSPFSDQFSSGSLRSPLSLSPRLEDKIRARGIHLQAENIYGSEEKTKTKLPPRAGRSFYGTPFKRYLLDDYTRFPTMEEVMREFVYEVMVRKRKGQFYFFVYNLINERHFQDNPLVLFDGVPVFDMDQVMALNPLKVESLEVVNETFFLESIPYPGILSFSTFQGDMDGLELSPDVFREAYEGLQESREFYVPPHGEEKDQQQRIPDFRNLLYWSPDVQTDAEGKKTINFYTSDLEGEYQVEIQGITKEGKAASTSFTFKVAEKAL